MARLAHAIGPFGRSPDREEKAMDSLDQPLSSTILAFNYMGDVVFAISGALTAGRHKMDVIGYLMVGVITGIGGGTLRDLLLGRKV